MSSTAIMNAILGKIKTVLSQGEEILAGEVPPEQAEEVTASCRLAYLFPCTHSVLSLPKNLSTGALSQQLPLRLMLHVMRRSSKSR